MDVSEPEWSATAKFSPVKTFQPAFGTRLTRDLASQWQEQPVAKRQKTDNGVAELYSSAHDCSSAEERQRAQNTDLAVSQGALFLFYFDICLHILRHSSLSQFFVLFKTVEFPPPSSRTLAFPCIDLIGSVLPNFF
jgi:hypothetical protein